jgi:hypothetical protein
VAERKQRAPRSLYVLFTQDGHFDANDIFTSAEAAKTEQLFSREVYDEKLDIRRYVIAPKAKPR